MAGLASAAAVGNCQAGIMINLNSDLGEGVGDDAGILPYIDSANVACAVHAGSALVSLGTVRRCRELGVEVGAHPGYDDRQNFGRAEVPMSVAEIDTLVRFQVLGLAAVAELGYIKPHGALYHRAQADPEVADAIARLAGELSIAVMGQPGFQLVAAAGRAGVPAIREGFADRAYLPDGKLAPRTQAGSVLDPAGAAEQAIRFARTGEFDSVCIHGDSPGAGEVARSVREALRSAGVRTGPNRR